MIRDYTLMTNDELITEAKQRLVMDDVWEKMAKQEPENFRKAIIENLEMLDRHSL